MSKRDQFNAERGGQKGQRRRRERRAHQWHIYETYEESVQRRRQHESIEPPQQARYSSGFRVQCRSCQARTQRKGPVERRLVGCAAEQASHRQVLEDCLALLVHHSSLLLPFPHFLFTHISCSALTCTTRTPAHPHLRTTSAIHTTAAAHLTAICTLAAHLQFVRARLALNLLAPLSPFSTPTSTPRFPSSSPQLSNKRAIPQRIVFILTSPSLLRRRRRLLVITLYPC